MNEMIAAGFRQMANGEFIEPNPLRAGEGDLPTHPPAQRGGVTPVLHFSLSRVTNPLRAGGGDLPNLPQAQRGFVTPVLHFSLPRVQTRSEQRTRPAQPPTGSKGVCKPRLTFFFAAGYKPAPSRKREKPPEGGTTNMPPLGGTAIELVLIFFKFFYIGIKVKNFGIFKSVFV